MMEDFRKQKHRVSEAIETAKILRDIPSRIALSKELLKLNELQKIPETTLMDIRIACGLNSAIWITAEIDFEKEK